MVGSDEVSFQGKEAYFQVRTGLLVSGSVGPCSVWGPKFCLGVGSQTKPLPLLLGLGESEKYPYPRKKVQGF